MERIRGSMEGAEESTTRSSGEITTPPTINLTQNQPAIFFNLSLDDLTIRCTGYAVSGGSCGADNLASVYLEPW